MKECTSRLSLRSLRLFFVAVLFVWAALLVSCSAPPQAQEERASQGEEVELLEVEDHPSETRRIEQPAIYGSDDRTELYLHEDEGLREIGMSSVVAMIPPSLLITDDPENVLLGGVTLGEEYNLCSGQRFHAQPSVAGCTGTLIDDDLVLTAGHCAETFQECRSRNFVFNYRYEGPGYLATITEDDVYTCRRIVAKENGPHIDWAIIQLDRPATPHHVPAAVRSVAEPMAAGAEIALIGFGSGLPAKVDTGGRVIDARASLLDTFVCTTDSFAGHSGAPVFGADRRVAGVLSSGASDYKLNGSCNIVEVYPQSGANRGEYVTYAHHAIEGLCEAGWPSLRLCGITGSCGDDFCNLEETHESCPEDCIENSAAPWNWSCNGIFYGAKDDCDCGCGVVDPDCADPGLRLYGCDPGQSCDGEGRCTDLPPETPSTWSCESDLFLDGEDCDCTCGAYDLDCNDRSRSVQGCEAGQACDPLGRCVDSDDMPSPPEWTCHPSFYDAKDGCDCGCGVLDPDCEGQSVSIHGCTAGDICNEEGACERPDGLPDKWSCNASYYNAGDDCDCNCDAYDPDCDNPSLSILGCAVNQLCSPFAECVARPAQPSSDDGLCRVVPSEVPDEPSPWLMIGVLFSLWVIRRAYKKSAASRRSL